jgi:hypothetical protein
MPSQGRKVVVHITFAIGGEKASTHGETHPFDLPSVEAQAALANSFGSQMQYFPRIHEEMKELLMSAETLKKTELEVSETLSLKIAPLHHCDQKWQNEQSNVKSLVRALESLVRCIFQPKPTIVPYTE